MFKSKSPKGAQRSGYSKMSTLQLQDSFGKTSAAVKDGAFLR